MSSEKTVLHTVLETVGEHNMINSGDRILAAVSGGADSVCMLHILNSLKEELNVEIFCAHLNHCIRGAEADADQKFVEELCEKMSIPFFAKRVDVTALANEQKLTLEEAGRVARYRFFDELVKKEHLNKVATAHNKNDNAETVLMRILRGTGVDGLKGIAYVRDDGVIRPILDVPRLEIENYCEENGLSFCVDKTNSDSDYTRNKIRNELIPYLEKEFNAKITESLCRLSKNAGDDAEFLNNYARRLYERIGNPLPSKQPVTLHIESLGMLEKSVAARVVRIAADEAQPGVRLDRKHIEDIFDLMTKNTGASVDLPCKLKASVQYGWIAFESGKTVKNIPVEKDAFFAEVTPGQTVFVESIGKNVSFRIENAKEYKCKINETALSYDLIQGKMLFLRSRREGDRIVWFPDGKTKKIKNILIDDKIPQKDRNKIPLLCTGNEVLAIVGSRVSTKYKVTTETEKALVIEYGAE